jgi:predicted  nucleic acid-binding Zn-ribbon protein
MDELFVIRDINNIDLKIAADQRALRKGVAGVQQTTAAVAATRKALAEASARLEQLHGVERDLSRRVKELTVQRDRTRHLIDAGQAPDYDRAMQQLSQQDALLDETETTYLETIEEREAAEAEEARLKAQLQSDRDADAAARQEYRDQAPGLKARIAQQGTLRPALLEKIEPNRRRQYLDLQQRGMDALTHVVGGACKYCFQSTPPQIANEVRTGRRIHNCRGCGRFFFAVREESN